MTRVLHVACARRPNVGIAYQMRLEQDAAHALGLPWTVRLFTFDQYQVPGIGAYMSAPARADRFGSAGAVADRIVTGRRFAAWLSDVANGYDAVLVRHSLYDPYEASAIRQIRSPVFLVHHTKEGPELGLGGGIVARAKMMAEGWAAMRSARLAAGAVAVTSEIATYERVRLGFDPAAVCVYPNGGAWDVQPVADGRTDSVPHLLFVASQLRPWHGVDLLVDAITRSDINVTLDVVGPTTPELVRRVSSDSRIVLHGVLSPAEIRRVARQATVAIGSLALSRNCMAEACTLKVREYLSMGLPVYAGYKDVFPDDFPYYRRGECRIEAIAGYANEVRSVPRAVVAASARPFIDKRELLLQLYNWLRERLRAVEKEGRPCR